MSSLRRPLGCSKARHKPVRRSERPLKMPSLFRRSWLRLQARRADARCGGRRGALFCAVRATPGDSLMKLPAAPVRLLLAAAVLAALARPAPAHAQGAAVALASHRAVYDLKLSTHARQARDERGARPHPLRFLRQRLRGLCAAIPPGVGARQRRGQGDRLATCAPPRGRRAPPSGCGFIRRTTSTRELRDSVDGQAERDGDGVAVKLTKPGEKKLDLKNELVFPTEHIRRIIAAAREGKTLLRCRSMTAPTPARRSTTR